MGKKTYRAEKQQGEATMNLKKKAGLALALAAIFTTGGANLALADNVSNGGTVPNSGSDQPVEIIGGGDVTISGGSSTVQKLTTDGTVSSVTIGTAPLTIVGDGSALIGNGNAAVPMVKVTGTALNLTGGSGSLNGVELSGADLNVGTGEYEFNSLLSDGTGSNVIIGNNTSSGSLNITGNADLQGTVAFVDPAWANGTTALDPSKLAIMNFASTAISDINGVLVAGQNSHIVLGQPDSTWIDQMVEASGWWAKDGSLATAALGLYRPFIIDDTMGNITVDGSYTTADLTAVQAIVDYGNATFAADSLLVVDAANGGSLQASVNGGTVTVGDAGAGSATQAAGPAYLYIANAKVGNINILSGFDTITVDTVTTGSGTSWTGNYLKFDNILLTGTGAISTNTTTTKQDYNVTATNMDAGAVLPKLSSDMANTINGFMAGGFNDVNSDEYDVAFFSRALSRAYGADNSKSVVTAVEGLAAAAAVAGVPYTAINITNTVADIINGRAMTLNRVASPAGGEPGQWAIWVKPFYSNSDVDGMKVGKHDNKFETNYGGAVLGLDTNINENFTLGLALNIGGGDTESKGDFAKTKSDFDFWGLSLYGAYTYGDFGLIGDVGFSEGSYDLKQRSSYGLSRLKGDTDTSSFTVGLTGEYVFDTGYNLNIAPHLGFRYTNLKMDGYNMKADGYGHVVKSDLDRQNLWTIPIGVTFSQDYMTDGGWHISPMMDLGLIVAAGDTEVDNKYNFVNLGRGSIESEVADDVTFNGVIGIKAKGDSGLSLGLDYNIKASENLTSHSFAGMLRYEF
ncbi:hypothetical protein C4J81_18955 (plasmid) [Deltaproteobacteria bacterium Smac51]|nr:hypothetical protein C4J81_18955 [Deltaproteobacteria bacterium Smac51]